MGVRLVDPVEGLAANAASAEGDGADGVLGDVEFLGELGLGAAVPELLSNGVGDLVEDAVVIHELPQNVPREIEH